MQHETDFITTYFSEERITALCIIIIGIMTIFLACIFLLIIKYSFFKGIAIPFLVIGLLQLIIGTVIFTRSPNDIIKVQHSLRDEPQKIKTEELPRIEKVIHHFTIYKSVEVFLIISCGILLLLLRKTNHVFWKGVLLGVLIQTVFLFTLDMVADKSAQTYLKQLKDFEQKTNTRE